MHFNKMKSMLSIPAVALCVSIGFSSAHASDVKATLSANIPAADTSAVNIGMISSNEQVAIGLVRTTEEMVRARDELAARQAALEAARQAEQEAKQAEQEVKQQSEQVQAYKPNYDRVVAYSPEYSADKAISANGKALGNFKITFYCGCAECSGIYGNNTATGTTCTEGRTIAVDPKVIPLGSKVYIEGYGSFIAEDTGGAIKQNKIDIYLNDHDRCYAMGVANANVYIMS